MAEPIKGGVEVGLRLGLGKAEEDRQYTAAENVVRKRLEVEIQADEDAARTQRREVGMAKHVLHLLGGNGLQFWTPRIAYTLEQASEYISASVLEGQQIALCSALAMSYLLWPRTVGDKSHRTAVQTVA